MNSLPLVIACVVGPFALVDASALPQNAEKAITRQDLPRAVQEAVTAASKGAVVRGFSQEVKDGQTFYEAELRVNGRTRDITFDAKGTVVADEQETPISAIPAAARSAIERAASGGKITLVEKVVEGAVTSYEGHITKAGKQIELKVDANGKTVQ